MTLNHALQRKIPLVRCVLLGLALVLTTSVILVFNNRDSKVTISFVKTEASHGQFPSYMESVRLDFAVRNAGSKPGSVVVSAIEDERGNWNPSFHILGEVEPRQRTQLYLYLPQGSHPRSLRMRVNKPADVIQKAQYALRLLRDNASGRYLGKQVWFDRLSVPGSEFVVRLWNEAEPNGAAPGSVFGSASRLTPSALRAPVAGPKNASD